jgi:hypothetical protein
MGVRIDNTTELKSLLQEWLTTDGIQEENTVVHSLFQNSPAERSIQTSENDFRAILKGQGLPLEFWDEAAVTGAYIRNCIINGPRLVIRHSPYTKHSTERLLQLTTSVNSAAKLLVI